MWVGLFYVQRDQFYFLFIIIYYQAKSFRLLLILGKSWFVYLFCRVFVKGVQDHTKVSRKYFIEKGKLFSCMRVQLCFIELGCLYLEILFNLRTYKSNAYGSICQIEQVSLSSTGSRLQCRALRTNNPNKQLCLVAVGEPMGKWGILFMDLLSSPSIMFDAAPLGA